VCGLGQQCAASICIIVEEASTGDFTCMPSNNPVLALNLMGCLEAGVNCSMFMVISDIVIFWVKEG